MTQNFCWISNHNAARWYVFGDYAACPHNGVFTDADVGENRGSRANRRSPLDYCPLDLPVTLGLQIAVGSGGSRITVVDEHHAVADEYVVFDGDAFADKCVARNLAA